MEDIENVPVISNFIEPNINKYSQFKSKVLLLKEHIEKDVLLLLYRSAVNISLVITFYKTIINLPTTDIYFEKKTSK